MSLGISRPSSPPSSAPLILAGVNSSEAILESGNNEHFRTIPIVNVSSSSPDISSPTGSSRRQLFSPITSKEMYQRVLRTKAGLVAIANGGGIATSKDFEIVVAGAQSFAVRRRIAVSAEAADLDLDGNDDDGDDDGAERNLVYCTAKEIFITSATKKAEQPRQLKTPPGEGSFRSIRFLSPSRIIVVRNRPARTGADLYLLDAATGAIVAQRALAKTAKAATALDVATLAADADNTGLAAVATADQNIQLFRVSARSIKPSTIFRNVHPFQITKVVFSPAVSPSSLSSPSSLLSPSSAASAKPISSGSSAYGDDDDDDAGSKSSSSSSPRERTSIRLASTSIGNTVVVHTIPLSGGKPLSRSSGLKQTVFSLVAVILFAVLLQYWFLTRSGFSGLPAINLGGSSSGSSAAEIFREKLAELQQQYASAIKDAGGSGRAATTKTTREEDAYRAGAEAGMRGAPFEDVEGRSLEDDLWQEAQRRPVESAEEDWRRRPMGDSDVQDVE